MGSIPEPHNGAIQRLLFLCAHWHGLAKLRMHSDTHWISWMKLPHHLGTLFAISVMKFAQHTTQKSFLGKLVHVAVVNPESQINKESEAFRWHTLKKGVQPTTYKYHSLDDYTRNNSTAWHDRVFSTAVVGIVY
jgi:hypothetical protein